MNVSLISMKNVIFLLANPPSKWPKTQKISRLRRARWSLIIMRNPESEIQMYRLLAYQKSSQMPMYRLLRGGRLLSIAWQCFFFYKFLQKKITKTARSAEFFFHFLFFFDKIGAKRRNFLAFLIFFSPKML